MLGLYLPASDAVLADGIKGATASRAFGLAIVSSQPERLHGGVVRRRELVAFQ